MNKDKNKNIFLYDFLLVKGGAESLTLTFLNASKNYDFCVAFSDHDIFNNTEEHHYNLIELTRYTGLLGWQSIKSILAFKFKTGFLSDYNVVIYSGFYSPVAIKNHLHKHNVYYCHTPPRFVYDLKKYYLKQATWWQRPLLRLLRLIVKFFYEQSIEKMDVIIANSDNVKKRIQQFLNKKAIVIHPPIATDRFNWIEQGDYYLSLARVEAYKRVDLIVQAFMNMPDKQLVVASGGSDLERLKQLAKDCPNIRFTDWCDESRLQALVGRCLATIYIPKDEDFGMSPVESMAAGKPVIGVAEGGLLETVVDGETGILIEQATEAHLRSAIHSMTKELAMSMRSTCESRSQLFQTKVFIHKMHSVLERYQ